MINKNKVNAILNLDGNKKTDISHEKGTRIEYETQIQQADKRLLTVIICKENLSSRYDVLREEIDNILMCDKIKYLNSVNHLDNVERIILDTESFDDTMEIAFLIRVFRLLHRHCEIILCIDPSILEKLKKVIDRCKEIYIIDKKSIDVESLKHAVKLSELKEHETKSWNIKKYLKPIVLSMVSIFIIVMGCLVAYLFINQKDGSVKLHNQNMNVQLDMGEITILPINTVYSDENGNHLVIEEISNDGKKETTISMFDSKHDYVASDIKSDECPDQKWTRHYVLTFSEKETDYYIVQIENGNNVKNVEIDARYFK